MESRLKDTMKLQGTINKHDLVRYLAREYARCKKIQRRYEKKPYTQYGEIAFQYLCQAEAYRLAVVDLRDNAI